LSRAGGEIGGGVIIGPAGMRRGDKRHGDNSQTYWELSSIIENFAPPSV
jgi:hypothetical protein